MAGQEAHRKLLTEFIQKQMVILGPNITLDTARKSAGLKIGSDGSVVELSGDPLMVLKSVAHEFSSLSPYATRTAFQFLLGKYPEIKGFYPS